LLDIQGTSLFLPETAPLDDAAGKAAGLDHHNTLDALPTTNAIPRNGACHRIDRPSPPVRQTGAKEDRSIRMLELHHRVIDIVENHPQPYDARLSAFMSEEQYRSNLRSEDMRYFLYLNALARVLQPRKVLELGTDQGCSALFLLLGLPQNSVLITIDKRATERSYLSPFFEDRRLRLVTGNDLDLKVFGGLSLHEIDLLFMDTVASYFQAQSEWLLYRNFLSSEAVVAIDDIHLNPEMERFWRELPQTKIDTGKAFHWSGFGLLGP
jgi:predicted O-methyltransferase YrrM